MTPAVPLDDIDIDVDGNTTKRAPDLDLLNRTNFSFIDMGAYEVIVDCNENGVPDLDDIENETSEDCNNNGTPDECDIDSGFSQDCNENGIPDECDIASGTSQDCNDNGIPDECDIDSGFSQDCNENGIPDECDIASGTSQDVNNNGIPDECEIPCPFGSVLLDPRCQIEIVLLLDTSTSMQGGDISGICNDVIPQIDEWIENLPDAFDVSITVLRLDGSQPSVCGGHPVTKILDYFEAKSLVIPGDNGDCIIELLPTHDEAVAPGAAVIADMFDWAPQSSRLIIPAGDEPPCNGNETGPPPGTCADEDVHAIDNLIDLADAKNVFLLPITGLESSTAQGCTVDLWNLAALATSGTLAFHRRAISNPNLNYFSDYQSLGEAFVNILDDFYAGLSPCLICTCDPGECPGDINDDGFVDGADLLILLSQWGPCPQGCTADLNCDGVVDGADLLILLSNWGECSNPEPVFPQELLEDCYNLYGHDAGEFLACVFSSEELQSMFGEGEEEQ